MSSRSLWKLWRRSLRGSLDLRDYRAVWTQSLQLHSTVRHPAFHFNLLISGPTLCSSIARMCQFLELPPTSFAHPPFSRSHAFIAAGRYNWTQSSKVPSLSSVYITNTVRIDELVAQRCPRTKVISLLNSTPDGKYCFLTKQRPSIDAGPLYGSRAGRSRRL